jgi:ABC-2 type transport system permease protein
MITLLQLELRLLLRSPVWWTTAALAILLIGFALTHGHREHERRIDNRTTMFVEEQERLATMNRLAVDMRGMNPEAAGRRFGFRYAAKPELPLDFAVTGLSDLQSDILKVSTDPVEEWLQAHEWENPHRLFYGRFDLAFVLTFLLPLAVIALAAPVLSEERDRGILPMLRTQGFSLRRILVFKLAVRYSALTAVVLFALLAFASLPLATRPLPLGLIVTDMGMLALLSAAYLLAWFCIAGLVVSFTRGSAFAMGTLTGVWVALLVLLPASVNLVLDAADSGPGRFTYTDRIREVTLEAEQQAATEMGQFYHDHPELLGRVDEDSIINYSIGRTAIMLDVEHRVAEMAESFRESQLQRNAAYRRVAPVLFPLHFQSGLMSLAGTGMERHVHFLNEVSRYHRLYRTFFFERIVRGDRFVEFHRIPRFAYREEYLAVRWGRVVTSGLLMLTLPLAVLLLRLALWRHDSD